MTVKLIARLRAPKTAPAPAPSADPLTTRERNILRKLDLTSRVQVAVYAAGHDAQRNGAHATSQESTQ
ncbi:hypothetical protein AWB71_03026 [Caballeronia peredens]|nr:hypothetical protein AWB71_03026 [Caballeronia peredens]